MPEMNCACQRFQRLEGAAAQAYLTKYLDRIGAAEKADQASYRCRVCGARWRRVAPDEQKRPSLVREGAE